MEPKSRRRGRRYGLTEETQAERHSRAKELSELFVDDAWGTAKSFESLQQHKDFRKWAQQNKLTGQPLKDLQRRLVLYEELRNLDPEGFAALTAPISTPQTAPSSLLSFIYEYLFNTVMTACLCILAMWTSSTVMYTVATAGLGAIVSIGMRLQGSRQSLGERIVGLQLIKEHSQYSNS